eukprot:COSAG06_NODE_43_length_29826_cov_32.009621_6_plen_72_part_00
MEGSINVKLNAGDAVSTTTATTATAANAAAACDAFVTRSLNRLAWCPCSHPLIAPPCLDLRYSHEWRHDAG